MATKDSLGRMVALTDITIDPDVQVRLQISPGVVKEYAEELRGGTEFDPVKLFQDLDNRLILGDGHHRYAAHQLANIEKIAAIIDDSHPKDAGSYALESALTSNCRHGKTMSRAEKRIAVTKALADQRIRRYSDSKLARLCGVSSTFVAEIRSGKGKQKPESEDKPVVVAEHERALPTPQEPEKEEQEEITLLRKFLKDGRLDWQSIAEVLSNKKSAFVMLPRAATTVELKSGDKLLSQHKAVVTVEKGLVTVTIEEEGDE